MTDLDPSAQPDALEQPDEWYIVDNRTAKPVSINTYPTRYAARRQIKRWYYSDLAGRARDIHEVLPYLEARKIESVLDLPGPYDPALSPKARPCPNCLAKIGESCTQPTGTGRVIVNWFHYARESKNYGK